MSEVKRIAEDIRRIARDLSEAIAEGNEHGIITELELIEVHSVMQPGQQRLVVQSITQRL